MSEKVVQKNKKALHDYHLSENIEAGMVLKGTEIKSIREGRVSMLDCYVKIRNNEAWLVNLDISTYTHGNLNNHSPLRDRKLLLHKREIIKLQTKVMEKGFTLIPTKIYLKDGKAKIEIALAKGKAEYDKRQSIKKKETARTLQRAMKMKGSRGR